MEARRQSFRAREIGAALALATLSGRTEGVLASWGGIGRP